MQFETNKKVLITVCPNNPYTDMGAIMCLPLQQLLYMFFQDTYQLFACKEMHILIGLANRYSEICSPKKAYL